MYHENVKCEMSVEDVYGYVPLVCYEASNGDPVEPTGAFRKPDLADEYILLNSEVIQLKPNHLDINRPFLIYRKRKPLQTVTFVETGEVRSPVVGEAILHRGGLAFLSSFFEVLNTKECIESLGQMTFPIYKVIYSLQKKG